MKVLDTTVAVDYLRGRAGAVTVLERLLEEGERPAASEVVRFELLAGARPGELEQLEAFFSALAWIAVDEHVSREAAGLARIYRRSHSGINVADYLIAATNVLLNAELITTNVGHFPMFAGLEPPY